MRAACSVRGGELAAVDVRSDARVADVLDRHEAELVQRSRYAFVLESHAGSTAVSVVRFHAALLCATLTRARRGTSTRTICSWWTWLARLRSTSLCRRWCRLRISQ
jgi:hypothetical protein